MRCLMIQAKAQQKECYRCIQKLDRGGSAERLFATVPGAPPEFDDGFRLSCVSSFLQNDQKVCKGVERRGKALLLESDGGCVFGSSLGLSSNGHKWLGWVIHRYQK